MAIGSVTVYSREATERMPLTILENVPLSPLSTIGALCVASLPASVGPKASKRLFNQLLAWGLSMTVVGAIICWVLFGLA